MTDEAYERIKASEKAHLRQMKELRAATRRLRRARRMQEAATGGGARRAQDLLDESDALVRRLGGETARSEARLDLALEARSEEDAPAEQPADPKARAKALVRRLREEMNASGGSLEDGNARSNAAPPPDDDRPKKTIGRMR